MATPADVHARQTKARQALDLTCRNLASAKHNRHRRLYGASFAMGAHVAAGRLDYEEAGDALFQAATANGFVAKRGAARVIRIIKDALAKGEAKSAARRREAVA